MRIRNLFWKWAFRIHGDEDDLVAAPNADPRLTRLREIGSAISSIGGSGTVDLNREFRRAAMLVAARHDPHAAQRNLEWRMAHLPL